MYNMSKLLAYILDKYKIYKGKKIDLFTLEKISKKEKIDINDLVYLLEINKDTYYKLKTKKQKFTKLKFKKYQGIRDIKLIRQGKINKEQFNKIIIQKNIKPFTLLRLLGISTYSYYKMINNEDAEVKIVNVKLKHKVELIKMDLKYINGFGNRYYEKRELIDICENWKITLEQFLKYYSKNSKQYKFNKIVLQRSNKGLWIGEGGKISEKFIKENYEILKIKLKKVIQKLNPIYGWKYLQDDLVQQAITKIYEKMRKYTKNFLF